MEKSSLEAGDNSMSDTDSVSRPGDEEKGDRGTKRQHITVRETSLH